METAFREKSVSERTGVRMVPVAEALEMTVQEVLDLPVMVPLRTAGRALGLNESTSYRLAKESKFPVRVVAVGARFKVPRAALMDVLGISEDLRVIRHPETAAHMAKAS